MSERPKILYATSHCLVGPTIGARIRALQIGEILKRIGDVSVALVVSDQIQEADLVKARNLLDVKTVIAVRESQLSWHDRIRLELNPTYLTSSGRSVCVQDRNTFLKMADGYDIIWFHTVRIPDAFRVFRWKKSVLDVDDMRSQLYMFPDSVKRSITRKVLDARMIYRWRRREQQFLKRFDVVCVCSEQDRALFDNQERTYVVQNGFDIDGPTHPIKKPPIDEPIMGFIGTLDYPPNRIGLRWFVDSVWPMIRDKMPSVRLRIVGQGTKHLFQNERIGIECLGWVNDVGKEIDFWTTMIVPILNGGGTRIKIIEGFARKCPVVTTSIGAYGISIEHGREAVIADGPERFADACIQILKDQRLRQRIVDGAYKKYLELWTWKAQEKAVSQAVAHCLRSAKK